MSVQPIRSKTQVERLRKAKKEKPPIIATEEEDLSSIVNEYMGEAESPAESNEE